MVLQQGSTFLSMQMSNKKEKTLRKEMKIILLSPRLDCD